MQKLYDITFTGKTDKGLMRDHNEDNYVSTVLWDSSILLCCIDGVGGMSGGAVCSATVAERLEQYLKEMQLEENPIGMLKHVLVKINNDIISMQKEMPEYSGMGCVLTAVLVDTKSNKVYMTHVGDTRLYEFVDGQLVKLSHDHSPVGVREEMGILTEAEAMSHPKRNVIERCLGDNPLHDDTDYIETGVFPFKAGATYLLCSDGLTDLVTAAGICQILAEDTDVDNKTDKLVSAANDAGGKDNITVLLLDYPDKRTEEEKLADSLIDNETIGKSEACLVPDNGTVEADASSQLLDVIDGKDKDIGKSQSEKKEESSTMDKDEILPELKNRIKDVYEGDTLKKNGSNRFLTLLVVALIGVIIWMGHDIHIIKENQKQMMNDTVVLKSDTGTGAVQPVKIDTMIIDTVKYLKIGNALYPIGLDSLKVDSLLHCH